MRDGGDSHSSPTPGSSPVSPELPRIINAAGLSEWMSGVDKQLEDLHAQASACPREGTPAGLEECVTGSPEGRRRRAHPIGGDESAAEEKKGEEEEGGHTPEDGKAKPTPVEAKPPEGTDLVVWMEERLRRLEENWSLAVAPSGEPRRTGADGPLMGTAAAAVDGPRAAEETAPQGAGRGCSGRVQHRAELSGEDPSPSPSPGPRARRGNSSSAPPTPVMAVDGATGAGPASNVERGDPVEDGAAIAQRAAELAEEALKVGREAAERCERTGEEERWGFFGTLVCGERVGHWRRSVLRAVVCLFRPAGVVSVFPGVAGVFYLTTFATQWRPPVG